MRHRRYFPFALFLAALGGCGASNGDLDGALGGGTAAKGGAPGSGRGGASNKGGEKSDGGATSAGASGEKGGAPGRGGAANKGGTSGSGGSAAKGGATGSGGAHAAGASNAIDCLREGDAKTTLAFVNHCAGSVTFAGSDIQGGALLSGSVQCVDVGNATDAISSKRYWGYAGEDPGAGKYSLAEFTFNTDFQNFDWYNISYVDAFNLPLQIVPVARANCKLLTCADDFLSGCPTVGRFEKAGKLLACVNPSRNDGTNPVASYFETCDEAYAWSGDDQNGSDPSPVRACAGEDFQIVFCPPGSP